MKIRNKLAIQFTGIVASILITSLFTIYFSSSQYRYSQFNDRLRERAKTTAKLLVDVDEVDSTLLKIIDKNSATALPKENILIYDYEGKIIYESSDSTNFNISDDKINNVISNREIEITQGKFQIIGLLFNGRKANYIVFAGASDIFGIKKLLNLQNILITVFVLGILVVLIAGWFFAGRALYPISRIVRQVDNITITNINLRVDEGMGKDEISVLANTFNHMLDRLEKAFNMQKNFVNNASHELRTPLTAMTGQLEVALMSDRSEVYYRNKIQSVLEDIRKLTTISNQLLILAQASNDESTIEFRPERIDELIWQAEKEIIKMDAGYKIRINFINIPDNAEEMIIHGNNQLLKLAFINLAENGCKFSDNHRVLLEISFNPRQIIIDFTNTGSEISDEDLPLIFEPFYRGKNAINVKGYGIGLSIVEKIINLHKGKIMVTSSKSSGTKFTVCLNK